MFPLAVLCLRLPGRWFAGIRYSSSLSQGELPSESVCMCYACLIYITQVHAFAGTTAAPLYVFSQSISVGIVAAADVLRDRTLPKTRKQTRAHISALIALS